MTVSPQSSLLNHPAFAELTSECQELLQKTAVHVEYGIGQPLSNDGVVPNRILIMILI